MKKKINYLSIFCVFCVTVTVQASDYKGIRHIEDLQKLPVYNGGSFQKPTIDIEDNDLLEKEEQVEIRPEQNISEKMLNKPIEEKKNFITAVADKLVQPLKESIEAGLESESVQVQEEALSKIKKYKFVLGKKWVVDALIDQISAETDSAVKDEMFDIVKSMGKKEDEGDIEDLMIDTLLDKSHSEGTRIFAAETLVDFASAEAVDALLDVVSDDLTSNKLLVTALEVLVKIGDKRVVSELSQILNQKLQKFDLDESKSGFLKKTNAQAKIFKSIVSAIGELGGVKSVETLIEIIIESTEKKNSSVKNSHQDEVVYNLTNMLSKTEGLELFADISNALKNNLNSEVDHQSFILDLENNSPIDASDFLEVIDTNLKEFDNSNFSETVQNSEITSEKVNLSHEMIDDISEDSVSNMIDDGDFIVVPKYIQPDFAAVNSLPSH